MTPISLPPETAAGFTLVEVLCSLLLLAVGMLGAIKMQIIAAQSAQQSIYFNSAIALAADMSDRMLGNPAMLSSRLDNPYVKVNFKSGQDQIETAVLCYATHCTSGQLAASDISEWLQNISSALPDVHAVICRDEESWNQSANGFAWDCHSASGNAGIVIKIGWTDKSTGNKIASPQLVIPVVASGG